MAKAILYAIGAVVLFVVGLHILANLISTLFIVAVIAGIIWLVVWALRKAFGGAARSIGAQNLNKRQQRQTKKRQQKVLKQQRNAVSERRDVNSQFINPYRSQSEHSYKER